jgi:DNA-binding SARP family transcriptional activator/tetratricopeptide (TPR) repeat protein
VARRKVAIRLFGQIEVWAGAERLSAGPAQQSAVLAALAVDAGRVVPVDVLVERVWGAQAPEGARRTLHSYIARLRRLTERIDGSAYGPARLDRQTGGYVLDIGRDLVDLHLFRHLVEQARDAAAVPQRRLDLLREAVSMRDGTPLAGLVGDWVERSRRGWEQERVDAVVAWADAELRAGDPAALPGPLGELAAEHPLAEPLAAVLMRALAATGRGADALAHYAAVRQRLVEVLGADPGPELRGVHQAVLRGEIAPPEPEPAAGAAPRAPTPGQLPADVSGFTGRGAELAELDAALAPGAGRTAMMVITAVSGTAGVGKTALAVHFAHQVRERYRDGQLYVNLRGYHADHPMTPGDALAGFLRALGVAGRDVPSDLEERAALYRSELSGRRVLVVLDNATDVAQVRPLLPGAPTCAVLVTSRDSLAGLVAVDGARRLDLDLLPLPDALGLLHRLIGTRVDTQPEAAVALAQLCVRLPLALRIAAELANTRPDTPLTGLVAELAGQRRRLELLQVEGDPRSAVRAVFSWSYQHLPAGAARTFRLLGLHAGTDIDAYAAAELLSGAVDDARRHLELLARAHLLHPTASGRYGMHDLLRDYAYELCRGHDSEERRREAVARLLDHYVRGSAAAASMIFPYDSTIARLKLPRTGPPPFLVDAEQAEGWLEAELANLLAVAEYAAGAGWPGQAVALSEILHRQLRTRGLYTEGEVLHSRAVAAARAAGDPTGEARSLVSLGGIRRARGDYTGASGAYDQALSRSRSAGDPDSEILALSGLAHLHHARGDHQRSEQYYDQSLALSRSIGSRIGESNALRGLGDTHRLQGRLAQAVECYRRTLELSRAEGYRAGELDALWGLADIYRLECEYEESASYYEQALEVARTIGDRSQQGSALVGLGLVRTEQGRYAEAVGHFADALTYARQTGDIPGEMYALVFLSQAAVGQGEPGPAATYLEQALSMARDIGDRNGQFEALLGLGSLALSTGDPDRALTLHTEAIQIAAETNQPHDEARAHDGLAQAYLALGQAKQARAEWERALEMFTALGTPEGPRITERLAALDKDPDPPGEPLGAEVTGA